MRLALFCRRVTYLAAALFLTCTSGCVGHQPRPQPVMTSPNAPLYTYLIVHGIARGALMSGKIHSNELDHLIALDHTAQHAVNDALTAHIKDHNPAPTAYDAQATNALSQFLSYIER